MTDILSLDNNGIYREISLVENYIWLNKIDREGQMQEKIQILIFFLYTKPLSATADTSFLWLNRFSYR